MTKEEITTLSKLAVEYSNKQFSLEEKEFLKQAIDKSNSLEDLLKVAMISLPMGKRNKTQ